MFGCPSEEQWPYDGNPVTWPPKEPPNIDEFAKTHKIFVYQRVRSAELWLTEERSPLKKWGVVQMIKVLGRKAGITDARCSPHTFRHTFATFFLQNGGKEFEVQAILGHSTLAMTRKYAAIINSQSAAESHKRFSPVENMEF
jgi:site-specific recombinase XerD